MIATIARRLLQPRPSTLYDYPPVEEWYKEGGIIMTFFLGHVHLVELFLGYPMVVCASTPELILNHSVDFFARYRLSGMRQLFPFEEVWRRWRMEFWMKRILRRNLDTIIQHLYRPGGYFCQKSWEAIQALTDGAKGGQ